VATTIYKTQWDIKTLNNSRMPTTDFPERELIPKMRSMTT